MNDNRALPWVWKALEAAAFAAVFVLLNQVRQQASAVEERVERLDTRLAEYAVTNRQTASAGALPLAGDAALGDQEALAQRIVALLQANVAAPAQEEDPPASPEAESLVRQAQRIVGEALLRGRLEREAVVKLRELQSLSGNDPRFTGMRNEIIAAINQQKLVPEDAAFVAF